MDIDQIVRPLLLKDLRAELRLRGQSPAGGQEELRARLKENMMVTGNFNITAEGAMGATHAGGLERPACNNCQHPPPRFAACSSAAPWRGSYCYASFARCLCDRAGYIPC